MGYKRGKRFAWIKKTLLPRKFGRPGLSSGV